MSKPKPLENLHELTVKTVAMDEYVSGKFAFTLHDEEGIEVFESGFVYSSHDDATQAGDDAIMTAILWQDDNYLERIIEPGQ